MLDYRRETAVVGWKLLSIFWVLLDCRWWTWNNYLTPVNTFYEEFYPPDPERVKHLNFNMKKVDFAQDLDNAEWTTAITCWARPHQSLHSSWKEVAVTRLLGTLGKKEAFLKTHVQSNMCVSYFFVFWMNPQWICFSKIIYHGLKTWIESWILNPPHLSRGWNMFTFKFSKNNPFLFSSVKGEL